MPSFRGASPFSCDWGEGPIEVNAFTYARYLPKALKFREFTANIAFAAREPDEYQAKRRVQYAKRLLDEIGVGGERLEMYNLSSSEGPRFVEIATEMTERIRELGPSPIPRRNLEAIT